MTKQHADLLEDFFKKIFFEDYYIEFENIKTPKNCVTLFNPVYELEPLLRVYEKFNTKLRRVNSVVAPDVYLEKFYRENRHDRAYYFHVPVPGTQKILSSESMAGVVGSLEMGGQQTMSAVEAILYHLFYQHTQQLVTPLFCPIVTITLSVSMTIPLVVGFDENEVCNHVRLYSTREAQSFQLGMKNVTTRLAYLR